MKNLLLPVFLLIVHSILLTACQRDSAKLPEDVEERINLVENSIQAEGRKWTIDQRMEALKIPGVSVGVIHNYKLDWAKGYGLADIKQKREVTPSTLFQAASISKSLTGVGLVKLAQDNKVRLDEDVNQYLKSWKFPYNEITGNDKITLNNLLSHSAGLTVHGFRGYKKGRPVPTVLQVLNGEVPANNEPVRSAEKPNTRMQYSGGGTTVAQLVAMDVSGKDFNAFMKDEVLDPLGMKSSFYRVPNESEQLNLATGYLYDKTEMPGKYNIHPEQGAASLWTNPSDLAKYIIETQLSLRGQSSKVLNQEFTRKRLTTIKDDAALGVFIHSIGKAKYFQHSGANEGFRCLYIGDFDKGNGVVIMVNSENNKIIPELLLAVAQVYAWDGYSDSGIKLSQEKLKEYEGFYQAAFNSDFFLQMVATEKGLMLRQLWDGREIVFEAQSEFEFFNKEMQFPLKFSRDAKGNIAEVLAFNRDVWKRDPTFQPVVKKVINLSPEQLKLLEGKFRVKNNKELVAELTAKEGHIHVRQLWDGGELILVPESELSFFVKDNPYRTVKFIRDSKGNVVEIIAFGREVLERVE